jgi:two-component system, chemotaxis family, sensor kinase CheA
MSELDEELVKSFLEEASDLLGQWEGLCLKLEKEVNAETLNALFRIAHNIKGSSRAVGLAEVGKFIHIIEDVIVALKEGKCSLTKRKLNMFLEAQSIMQDWFAVLAVESSYKFWPEDFLKTYFSDTFQFVEDEVTAPIQIVDTAEVKAPVASPTPAAPSQAPVAQKATEEAKVIPLKKEVKDEVLRVSTKKIDGLLNLIGELSIQQSILENSIQQSTYKDQEALIQSSLNLSRKITKEIYSMAFGLRMTPIGGIFQRLERAIKDLGRDLSKEVDITFHGNEVEIEKTILDKLIDPLTHIVRNSVDHGLEKNGDREEKGKPYKGQITISATKLDDGVEVVVKDDGKGLDQKRILEKAIEKGLVAANANLSKEEIFSLIFLPGFSTAEKVTNVSGRGVGMDVVMKTLEEVNGKILVASEEGRGTKFKIMIPTSLSIVDSLIVSVNADQYVIPIHSLEEVVDVDASQMKVDDSVYVYRGKVIPFLHLRDVFDGKKQEHHRGVFPIIVTKVQGKRMALGIDQVLGQHQSVVRTLSSYFEKSFAISGGTILPSGEPGLILNITSICEKYFKYLQTSKEVAA